MISDEIKRKLEKEKKVAFVSEINYLNKTYAKTIKQAKNGIEYIYFEIYNNEIKEILDEDLITYFKDNYEIKTTNIIY